MKSGFKIFIVLIGFLLAIVATSVPSEAQKNNKKRKKGEGCIGKGVCGKTKTGKPVKGQYRVW